MRSSTAMNSSGRSPILTSNSSKLLLPPPLLLLSSRTCSQPSSLPLLVLPSRVASPSTSLWVLCHKLSPGRRTPTAILPCTSSLFSIICPRTDIPSAVPLPFLNPSCSSPKSPSTLLLILASKTIANSFST